MIFVLRISSLFALAIGCLLLAVTGVRWWDGGPNATWMQDIPGVADILTDIVDRTHEPSSQTAPLVAQAEAFAAYLSPPGKSKPRPAPPTPAPRIEVVKAAPLPAATLTLYATSCYQDQPEKSLALVSASDAWAAGQRWVKEGSQFGSFYIHEIRRGEIVYRKGGQLYEVAIEPRRDEPSIIDDMQIGSRCISAVIDSPIRPLPSVTGPNDITITGD